MRRRYCTLFDSAYLTKGLLTLRSLSEVSNESLVVTVVALDREVERRIEEIGGWPGWCKVVPYEELERAIPELKAARRERTWREFCWMLASVSLRWLLRRVPPGQLLTYIDADLYFFSDPKRCYGEIGGDKSIAVVPHFFPKEYEHYAASSGRFNVCWVSMRRDHVGVACVDRWAKQCLKECDEATGGDQRYLDEWPDLYGERLHIFGSPAVGLAPWNVFGQKVAAGRGGGAPLANGEPVVFYHYHELATPAPGEIGVGGLEKRGNVTYLDGFRLSLGYPLRQEDVEACYRPYVDAYRAEEARMAAA